MATKFLGTTDEVTTCDCCGRKDLKSTVAISIDDGETVYYGSQCAAMALTMKKADVVSATKAADRAKEAAERQARFDRDRAEYARWEAFLLSMTNLRDYTGRCDVWEAIRRLGGITTARALYKESQKEVR